MNQTAPVSDTLWWKGAVIYQVYPRSYQDSNDDGIGDLPGLITRLPYIASLGVDAIWVCPIFKSPQRDFGYDVSDYRDIDPLFGTMDDCDLLIAEAHKLGLKVIFDLVLSHTSDKHPWFKKSRLKQDGMDDWYVWADPKPDGSPPNNWVALFGGPAWSFDPLRGQYYMHNFLECQPDLNYHNPAVQDAALEVLRFWLDRGVDGLRLDVVNFYFHDKQLRDNPPRPADMGFALQYDHPDPYSLQRHLYDKSQPENVTFVERMRKLTDGYEGRVMMGEIGDDYPSARMAEYTQGAGRLHTAYSFALMAGTDVALTPDYIKRALNDEATASKGEAWPCWAFSNHDVPRAPSRFGQRYITNPAWAQMLLGLLLSLRGTICMYQGEELGLPEAVVPYEKLQDPWGRHVWPVWQGRDGCRTPMPWNDALPNAGFSKADPWLPMAPEHQGMAVAAQDADTQSTLHFVRALTTFRKNNKALINGALTFHDSEGDVLAFTRGTGDDAVTCVFNLGDKTVKHGQLALSAFGFALVPASPASKSFTKP